MIEIDIAIKIRDLTLLASAVVLIGKLAIYALKAFADILPRLKPVGFPTVTVVQAVL